jgi:hypothetical protein
MKKTLSLLILAGFLLSSAPAQARRIKSTTRTSASTTTTSTATPITTATTQTVTNSTALDGSSFTELWNGYGLTSWSGNTLSLSPKASTSPSETHSAFVLSTIPLQQPYRVHFDMTTTKQLRTGSAPNPWEVGWLAFGYNNGKFKYVILKPNGYGVELGEALGNDVQNFLSTSGYGEYDFPIHQSYTVDLIAQNNVITTMVNGKTVLSYALSAKDQLGLNGNVGFYTEDASVQVSNISVSTP